MQPRSIEVFDGLRVTTEHIDHLQGAVHSAITDLRALLGLGQVHRGFDVNRVDDLTAQVDPGMAFDPQRRRVVSDEPITLEVPALGPDDVRYVCAAYDEVADGEAEGRPTRVWDSAVVTLRDSLPGPEEDAIVLARLVWAETGGFAVEPPEPPEPPEPSMTEPGHAAEPVPAAEPLAPPPPAAATFRFADQEIALGAAIGFTTFVRERLGATGPTEGFRHRLASQAIELAAGRWVMATHSALSADVALPPVPLEAGSVETTTETPAEAVPPPTRHATGWFTGTVLVEPDAVLQASAGIAMARPAEPGAPADADVDERGIASLRFPAAGAENQDLAAQLARGLHIDVRAGRSDAGALELTAWLAWDGEPTQALAAWLEAIPARVRARGGTTLIAAPSWAPPPLP